MPCSLDSLLDVAKRLRLMDGRLEASDNLYD